MLIADDGAGKGELRLRGSSPAGSWVMVNTFITRWKWFMGPGVTQTNMLMEGTMEHMDGDERTTALCNGGQGAYFFWTNRIVSHVST